MIVLPLYFRYFHMHVGHAEVEAVLGAHHCPRLAVATLSLGWLQVIRIWQEGGKARLFVIGWDSHLTEAT